MSNICIPSICHIAPDNVQIRTKNMITTEGHQQPVMRGYKSLSVYFDGTQVDLFDVLPADCVVCM